MRRICDVCGSVCYDDEAPEIVFNGLDIDGYSLVVCENCSIDYEEIETSDGVWAIVERVE